MERVSADNGFTFVWKIHNFSHCTQKSGEGLSSPTFFMNNCKWYLNLFPRGNDETPDYIGIQLGKESKNSPLALSVVFSISTVKGSFEESKVYCPRFPADNLTFKYIFTPKIFFKVPAINKRGSIFFCNTDTITVKCKIVEVSGVPINYRKICDAYTIHNVKKNTYSWNVKTFIDKKKKFDAKDLNLFENSSFTIAITSLKGYSDETFEIVIKQTNAKELYFSSCTLSLLNTENVLQSIRSEHWFEKSDMEQVWTLSFTPTKKLMSYPQQDKFLRFEFAVSKGVQYSGIEKIEQDPILQPKTSSNQPVVCYKPPTEGEGFRSWNDNLQRFYSDGILSDVTIRTPTKEYPVHKAMLCAQSVVFTAMFERDMKENQTGIIDIDDLKDETISKMLLYIYSGSVANLDWSLALDLYFTADKYRIAPLGEKCSDFMKENFSSANVCECLILADLHQDQHLKSFAQEFFMEHSADIINSDVWKEVMRENLSLAAETMHLLCLRNLKMS